MRNRIKYNYESEQLRTMRRAERELTFWTVFCVSMVTIALAIVVLK